MKKELTLTRQQEKQMLESISRSKEGISLLSKYLAESLMRAERREYQSSSGDVSNGYRKRRAIIGKKYVELTVPRTRQAGFYPKLLAILKDEQEETFRLSASLYTRGLTTEQVGDVLEEFYGQHYSKSSISRMAESTRQEVNDYLHRPLSSHYPIVYVDATYIPTRRDTVSKEAYLVVLGVLPDKTREVLAIMNSPSESKESYRELFLNLKNRGVTEVNLLVSDAFAGIDDAFASCFVGRHQLCVTHLKRRILNRVRAKDKATIRDELRDVFAAKDPLAAFGAFAKRHHKRYPVIQQTRNIENYFTYVQYHPSIHPMIRTTNWIERLNRSFKRVTKMRAGALTPTAALTLLGATATTIKAYKRPVYLLGADKDNFTWD